MIHRLYEGHGAHLGVTSTNGGWPKGVYTYETGEVVSCFTLELRGVPEAVDEPEMLPRKPNEKREGANGTHSTFESR